MATQWTAGLTDNTVLPASTLNRIGAAWESYTPTIKTGATTLTGTLAYAKYAQIQKTVFVQIGFNCASTGAANGIITMSYPSGLAPANNSGYRTLGTFLILDTGVAFYAGVAVVYDSTNWAGIAYGAPNYMGANTPAMTIVSGDYLYASLMYEVA